MITASTSAPSLASRSSSFVVEPSRDVRGGLLASVEVLRENLEERRRTAAAGRPGASSGTACGSRRRWLRASWGVFFVFVCG